MHPTPFTLLVVVAACGGRHATPRLGTGAVAGQAATAADPAAACPGDAELESRLRARWQIAPRNTVRLVCTPGHFGEPGYLVDLRVEDPDDDPTPGALKDVDQGTIILAAADLGRVLAEAAPSLLPGWATAAYQLADLDGDGVDEVLVNWTTDRDGEVEDVLAVTRVDAGGYRAGGEITLSYDNGLAELEDPADRADDDALPAREACQSTWHLMPRGVATAIHVTTRVDQARATGGRCLAAGEHLFLLGNDGLAPEQP